jgi:K+-sensing histidine kinase KdpD
LESLEPAKGRSPAVGGLVAVASVAAITGLVYGLREVMPVVSTGVAYMLAVLLVSSYWGLWLGLLTSVASALVFNFFHIPPTDRFTIAEAENWVALGVFLVAAVVTSTLADAARARAEEAEHRRREADLSAEMARVLLGGSSLEDSLRAVGQRIAAALGLASVTVELSWIDSDQRGKALPLIVGGNRVGTVLMPKDADPAALDALRDRVVPALETLVAAAKRRGELEAQLIETKALRRSDVVQKALLRSVSHDLRSPLAAQLERAVANVLENSSRFAGSQPVAVRAQAAGRSLTLRVSDRGPGIPKDELERIFEPFYRSCEQPAGGSGLGLAIARGFVEANGGRLRADSLPGQGTTFVFRLPVPSEARARGRTTDRPLA